MIPALDAEPWPTLGPEICDWIEDHLVHGPGDILGQPVQLTAEVRRLIYRAYEVYPRGHAQAGRRRFKRVVVSRRKGWAKTELAALIALAELDPTAPVRCDGWAVHRGEQVPVGRPVRDPYIPMVAVTEEQTEDLAYGAAREILSHSPLADAYDVGLERIMHRQAPGKMVALAGSPFAREGARTTFQHFDETHLFVSERLRKAHATMMRNLPKRWAADPWTLETTTMHAPGEDAIAERAHHYATDVAEGRVRDPRLLYDHLEASSAHHLGTKAGLRAAIKEASGDAWAWTDVETIIGEWSSAATSGDCRRYWLNQPVTRASRWVDPARWAALAQPEVVVADGDRVVLAFDGSYSRDSTALVGATVAAEPHLFVVEVWERPVETPAWRTPRNEVDAAVGMAMERWTVVELAPDPPGWHREIEDWEATYAGVVVRFETSQISRMGPAADAFYQLVADGVLSHDGDARLARHVANCVPTRRRSYIVPTKASPDSPEHIDAAVAAVVATARAMWHAANPAAEHDEYVAFTV